MENYSIPAEVQNKPLQLVETVYEGLCVARGIDLLVSHFLLNLDVGNPLFSKEDLDLINFASSHSKSIQSKIFTELGI